jgi:hypothetical protein
MIDVLYKVIFDGDLLPGKKQADVQEELAGLFNVDINKAAKLFSGKSHTVKSNLDLKYAKKYVRALAKLGALGYIVQEIVESEQHITPEPENDNFTQTGSFDVAAMRAFFEGKEAKKAENDQEASHAILSIDELDDVMTEIKEDGGEVSGVQNVLDAEQIAKMLNKDK